MKNGHNIDIKGIDEFVESVPKGTGASFYFSCWMHLELLVYTKTTRDECTHRDDPHVMNNFTYVGDFASTPIEPCYDGTKSYFLSHFFSRYPRGPQDWKPW